MSPAAQAFYDACCSGKEWDILAPLALDMSEADVAEYPFPHLVGIIRQIALLTVDPYKWHTIQPQIDKEITSLREGVADHYKWRSAFIH